MAEYLTSSGHQYSFTNWGNGEQPSECFDRQDWLGCLHGCMFCAQFNSSSNLLLEDDGLLHELLHLAMGLEISTHNSLQELRIAVVKLELAGVKGE